MTPDTRAFLAELCAERAGLQIDPDKAYLIESRLGPVARRERFGSVGELLEAVREGREPKLAGACVEAMAPSRTAFFRDRNILERVWRELIPQIARRRPDGVVRIWSAGCASGQEIYSLAILQAEAALPTGKVELFASDLSERQLDRARLGVYTSFEVQRGLSARQLVRHFDNRDEHFQLVRPLRQAVRWRQVNLLEDLAALGGFDVVLCRDVLGHMTSSAQARVTAQMAGLVAADGLLVLGRGEAAHDEAFVAAGDLEGVFRRAGEVRAAA